jgi:hypothetical protein
MAARNFSTSHTDLTNSVSVVPRRITGGVVLVIARPLVVLAASCSAVLWEAISSELTLPPIAA